MQAENIHTRLSDLIDTIIDATGVISESSLLLCALSLEFIKNMSPSLTCITLEADPWIMLIVERFILSF